MKVVKPVVINDNVFTSSSIPEPDPLRGEVEWIDPSTLDYINTPSPNLYLDASSTAKNGKIYFVGSTGTVVELNPDDDSTLEFGSYSGFYRACSSGTGDFVYAVGRDGEVLKIDTVNKSVSTFGTYSNDYHCCVRSGQFIYCLGVGDVMIIDTSNDSISFFGSYTGIYRDCDVSGVGDIYAVGTGSKVLKISSQTNDITEVDQDLIKSLYNCTTGLDGDVYAIGSYKVMRINAIDSSISYFGDISGDTVFFCSSIGNSGLIYAAGGTGPGSKLVAFDTVSRSTFEYDGPQVGTILCMSSSESHVYMGGQSIGDKIIKSGVSYPEGSETVLASTHRVYRSAAVNVDNPVTGVTKIPPTWIDIGPTNKWALFSDKSTETSKSASNMTIEITPGTSINSLYAENLKGATSATVTCTSASAGVVYTKTVELLNIDSVTDFYNWFFYEVEQESEFTLLDLPIYNDLTIEVVFTGSNIEVGRVVTGRQKDLGVLLKGATSDRIDYSTTKYDEFGEETYVKRPIVKNSTYPVVIDKKIAPSIQRYLDSINGQRMLWVGGIGDGQFISTFGTIQRSPIVYDNLSKVQYQIKVRGSI